MARTLVMAFTLLVAAPEALAAAPEEDVMMFTAYLAHPQNGAVDVPANTLVFAVEVTAMQLEGPSGETIACLYDPAPSTVGGVFEPMQVLDPGAYHVLGVPSDRADNYAGPGVTVDLGTFTVGSSTDEEAPVVTLVSAEWDVAETDSLGINVALFGGLAGAPLRFELDVGDSDTLLDETVDAASSWTQGTWFTVFVGDTMPEIDPETATVRVRAVDDAGNAGVWSAASSFDVVYVDDLGHGACSAAPGQGGGAGWLVVVVTAMMWIAGQRRRPV